MGIKKAHRINEQVKEIQKQKLFNEIKTKYDYPNEEYKEKLSKFDNIYEIATDMAKNSTRKYAKNIKQLKDDLVREFYYTNTKSTLEFLFELSNNKKYKNLSNKRIFEIAYKEQRIARLGSFIKKYGKLRMSFEKYYLNDGKEINISLYGIVKRYREGKITKKQFYELVREFKDVRLAMINFNSAEYRQRDGNHEISEFADIESEF